MGYNKDASGNRISASPLRDLGNTAFKRTDDGSTVMSINGSSAGTPEIIWNGEATYWTPEAQGSAETYAAHDGTYGWDTSPTTLGQETRFDYGSNRDITLFDTLSFWMQPKAYPADSDLQILWRTSGGNNPGNVLHVEDYVTNMDLDVWQHVEIPIADFALGADVAKVLFKYAAKGGQQFWFDDIDVNTGAGGGPFIFRVAAPDASTIYHVTMMVVVISSPGTGWNPATFANQTALANGLLLRQRMLSTSEVQWSINAKDNMDLFGRYHPQDDITFANGDLLVGFMMKPGGAASILVTDDKVLEYVVRDNLSLITSIRAFAHYGVEVIS